MKKLSVEREEKLNNIGFAWKVRNITESEEGSGKTDWDTRFEQLEEYKKANGDCNVSGYDNQNTKLGRWVTIQRQKKRKVLLSREREAKLNSIGFVWKVRCHADWSVRLQEYKVAFGDISVPHTLNPHPQLWRWVRKQRRDTTLTKERRAQLNSIGFDWGKQPNKRPSHLGKWATEQERFNRPKEVRENERVEQLNANSIPMNLKKKATTDKNENCSWETHFRELLAYLQTHGDHNVPEGYPHNTLLARWVSEQRNDYDLKRRGEQTSLTPLREAKLDAIGFTWFVAGNSSSSNKDVPPEDMVSSAVVRPEEARNGNKEEVRSELIGVARPDRITSG
jgi:hypothetical protein